MLETQKVIRTTGHINQIIDKVTKQQKICIQARKATFWKELQSLSSAEEINSFRAQIHNNDFLGEINTLKGRIVLWNSRNMNWITY